MLHSQLTHTVVHNWHDVISGAQFPKFTAGRNEIRLITQSVICCCCCCCRSMEKSPFSGCSSQTEEFSLLYEQLPGSTQKKKKKDNFQQIDWISRRRGKASVWQSCERNILDILDIGFLGSQRTNLE